MTIENEAKLIRRSVEQMRPGRGRKYTPALRHRIMRWLERAGQAGMSDSACSEATGVPAERFAVWRAEQAESAVPFELPLELSVEAVSKELVPIEVSPSILIAAGLVFATPRGFRVEGLTLEQAYALLREYE